MAEERRDLVSQRAPGVIAEVDRVVQSGPTGKDPRSCCGGPHGACSATQRPGSAPRCARRSSATDEGKRRHPRNEGFGEGPNRDMIRQKEADATSAGERWRSDPWKSTMILAAEPRRWGALKVSSTD